MTPAVLAEQLRRAGCVFAEEEAAVLLESARDEDELVAMVARRVAGAPLEHVVGWVAFRGLRLAVADGVFVPRQRSGFLVDVGVRLVRPLDRARDPVVVDLCCGAGAVGAALAAELAAEGRRVELHAADLDPRAVACAEANLAPWGGHVHRGDLLDGLATTLRGRVDVLVASPPYVPTDAIALMPVEARTVEPRAALDGGPDGLDLVRRIASEARPWLVPRGWLAVELGETQVEAALAVLGERGYQAEGAVDEEIGSAVVTGRATPEDRSGSDLVQTGEASRTAGQRRG